MDRAVRTDRAPAETANFHLENLQPAPLTSKEFLARADAYVDAAKADMDGPADVLEYLKEYHSGLAERLAQRMNADESIPLPARFKREPDIFLPTVRFGRTRLFLSKFIGDFAWRGVSL